MTVATTTRSMMAIGNSSTTVFPYSFSIRDVDHVQVYLRNRTTYVDTLLSPAVYTITGVGPTSTGGNLTYPLSGSPLASTHAIVLLRTVPYTQDLDITNQDGFFPETIEQQLDLLEMQIQQNADGVARSWTAPAGETAGRMIKGPAGYTPLWDENGDIISGVAAGDIATAQANGAIAAAAAIEATTARDVAISAAGANIAQFTTRAVADAASIPSSITYVRTAGYAAEGDLGDALYKKVGSSSLPFPLSWDSASGYTFEIVGKEISGIAAGLVGDGATNQVTAMTAIPADYEVFLPAGTYLLNSDVTSSASFRLARGAKFSGVGNLKAQVMMPEPTYVGQRPGRSTVIKKLYEGTAIEIVALGDSNTYGFDPTGPRAAMADPATGAFDAAYTRTSVTYAEAFAQSLVFSFDTAIASTTTLAYPGGTIQKLLSGYKSPLSGGPYDLAFIKIGINDAQVGGPTVARFKEDLVQLVERIWAEGTAVELLGSPIPTNPPFADIVRPYIAAVAEVAEELGVPYYNGEESTNWLDNNMSTDEYHYNSKGQLEEGWHLAAPYANLLGDNTPRVSNGSVIWPKDNLVRGCAWGAAAATEKGAVGSFPTTGVNTLGVYCEEDVYPVFHLWHAGGAATSNSLIYSANSDPTLLPYPAVNLYNDGTNGLFRRVVGPKLHKGWRKLDITAGTDIGYWNKIEFISAKQGPVQDSSGRWVAAKIGGTSSFGISTGSMSVVDWGTLVFCNPATFEFNVKLFDLSTTVSGVILVAQNTSHALGVPQDYVIIGREGTSFVVDQYVAGVLTRLQGIPTEFTAGTFDGRLLITYNANPGGNGTMNVVMVSDDGTDSYSSATFNVNAAIGSYVYPGHMTQPASAGQRGVICYSCMVNVQ